MGNRNIYRLKEKMGFSPETEDVDEYFELIDRIYYRNQGYSENFDEKTEITTWFFEDGRRISFDITGVTHLALFLLELSNDVDEQLLSLPELMKSHFLEENEWRTLK